MNSEDSDYLGDVDPDDPRAGVLIYFEGPWVKLKICAMNDDGTVQRVLRGVALPPEVARKCAERLTLASWKAEEHNEL